MRMGFLGKKSFCLSLIFLYIFLLYWMVSHIHDDIQTESFRVAVNGNPRQFSVRAPVLSDTLKTETSPKMNSDSCSGWCRRGARTAPPYFLTAVLLVRIYTSDLAKLSSREMHQWLYYLRYAGVEHVYVYDAYHYKNESQQKALDSLIFDGYVTYVDWSHRAKPYSIQGTQESAYQDCMDRWGNLTTWQSSIDIDEYPFSPSDTKAGFMVRFIANFSAQHTYFSQMTMQNFLFLGKPLNDTQQPFLIGRFWRRTKTVANALVKPIYQPKLMSSAGVHHHEARHGRSGDVPADRMRLNHYWGARLQNWGEDTAEILSKTEPDNSMEYIIALLKKCDVCLPNKESIYRVQWS